MGNFLGCGCCGDEAKDQTDGKKGKPLKYDPDFKGPIRGKSRRPKDLLCLALFVLYIIVWAAVGIYAWANGEPLRILYPTDSMGRLCGSHSAVRDKPYLLFFDITKCATVVSVGELIQGEVNTSSIFTCPTQQVCVDRCPAVNEFGVRNNPVCIDSVDTSQFVNITSGNPVDIATRVSTLLEHIGREECAPYYVASTEIGRRCIPTGVQLSSELGQIFNLTASEEIQNATNAISNFGELFTTLNIQSITDGTFAQGLLVNTRQFLLEVYRDLQVVWPALLIGVGIILVLSFTYICLMRCLAGVVVWTGILLSLVLLAGVAGFSYFQFYCFQDTTALFNQFDPNSTTIFQFINRTDLQSVTARFCSETEVLREFIDSQLPWFQYQEWTWLGIGIIGTLLLLILVLILIFLGKKIRISIAIIKEASKAVGGVPTSVFYPVVTWVLLLVVLAYWAVVALFLLTSSEPTYSIIMNASISESNRNLTGMIELVTNGTICDQDTFIEDYANQTIFFPDENRPGEMASLSCQFNQFVTSNFLLGLHVYHLFGLLWVGNYVLALGECTLAGGFASWYWAYRKPKDVPTFALVQSFGRALLFHSGSLAFGALIIAIVQLARAILAYIQKKLKGRAGKVAQCLLCCLQCCLWCLEKILKYINRQAYIEIAIYGYDFCTAACKAVKLLIRNILVTAVKDRIVAFLLFLGKLAITCAVGILAYLGFGGYLNLGTSLWGEPLNYYIIPIIFLVIAAYLISSGFMSVYHMAVDTIFICAMEDLERNNGQDKPYFMNKNLMRLLNVKNKEQTDSTEMRMESVDTIQA